MKWLRDLVKKPPEPAEPSAPAARAAEPPPPSEDELDRLRQALAEAPQDARAGCERELGAALAKAGRQPSPEDGATVLAAALCELADRTTALAWLEELRDEAALAETATGARIAEVRLAAARRVADPALLKRVADACRERDRGVYRHCTDALRALRRHEERERSAAELAQTLELLLESAPLPASRLAELEKAYDALGEETAASADCTRLLDVARVRVRDEAEALRGLQQLAEHAGALAAETARDDGPIEARRQSLAAGLDALRRQCADRPQWLASHAAARTLDEALHALDARLAVLAQDAERAGACERFLESASAGAMSPAAVDEGWQALPKPAADELRSALQARFAATRSRLAPPPEKAAPKAPEAPRPAPRRRLDAAAVEPLLAAIEQALEQGLLNDAEAAEKRLEQLATDAALPGGLARRHRAARAQLARLRGWARWGTDQAREHLIEEAEALLANHPDMDDLAHAVTGLRAEWKRLDGHGAASGAQWQRFDRAVEKAWVPVAAHRAAEAERSAQARAAKESLCAEWEAWLAGITWEHADWKALEARRSEIMQQWRAAPRAGFRDERALRKRFDALLAQLDARRDAAHRAEVARREELIAATEALREAPETAAACAEARRLQARWRDEAGSLRLKRSEEQKLWKRFRSTCDAVFARRDQERDEQVTHRQQVVEARQALLAELENASTADDPGAVDTALARFHAAWAKAPAAPREAAAKLDGRARELERLARQRIDGLRRERRESRFALLARKAQLAETVEAAAADGRPVDEVLAQARQAWDELPRLWSEAERAVGQRLAAAASATAEALAAGQAQRGAMLLDLEIALGLPSPEADAQARRNRQLSNLQQHFGGGSDGHDPEHTVVRWYATAATPDAEQGRRIEAVVGRVLERSGRRPAA